MKIFIALASLFFITFTVAGCTDSHAADAKKQDPEPAPACSYKEGSGLQITETGAKFIDLQTAEFTDALPKGALLRTAKGDFVYVKNGDRYLRTAVKVGALNGATFDLTDGLFEGDTVVVRGARGLWLAELQAVNGGVGCADCH